MSYEITPTGLNYSGTLTVAELESIAEAAATMGNTRLWILADAMNVVLTDASIKGKYDHFIELTQLTPKRLYQIRKTSIVYPRETRQAEYSFSLHDAVAQHFGYAEKEKAQSMMKRAAAEGWKPKDLYVFCMPSTQNTNKGRFRQRLVCLSRSAKTFLKEVNSMTYEQTATMLADMEHLLKLYQATQARMLFLLNQTDGEQESKLHGALARIKKAKNNHQ